MSRLVEPVQPFAGSCGPGFDMRFTAGQAIFCIASFSLVLIVAAEIDRSRSWEVRTDMTGSNNWWGTHERRRRRRRRRRRQQQQQQQQQQQTTIAITRRVMLIAGGEVTVKILEICNPAFDNWLIPNPEIELVSPDHFFAVYFAASRAENQSQQTGWVLLAGSTAGRPGCRCSQLHSRRCQCLILSL